MAEVRRRTTGTNSKRSTTDPVRRRRDQAAVPEDDEEDEDDEDVDVTQSTSRSRRPASRTKARATIVKRSNYDDLDDEDLPDEDDEDDEPAERRARKTTASTKKASARRSAPVDEDDEDEKPAPRRRGKTSRGKSGIPAGLHLGAAGAEEVIRSGGGSASRFDFTEEPKLVAFMESEVLATYRQHWVPQGSMKGGDRPFFCIGSAAGCPLCEMGDRTTATHVLNVLEFSDEGPVNKTLRIGIKAYKALKAAVPGKADPPNFLDLFFAVNRSGKGQSSQTNFTPVKRRDLAEDWDEIFDHFDEDDLDDILAEGHENVFGLEIIEMATKKQLDEQAKYLSED